MTRCADVFPVICPGEEAGAGLAPACWPDQKPVRACERVTRHSSAARGLHPQTGTGVCPPTWAGGRLRMLADQLDYVVGVDPHRDSHALAVVRSERRGGVRGERRRETATATREALRARRAARAGAACVRGRGHRLVRCRSDPLPHRPRRAGARGRQAAAGAPLGRQDRRARRGPRRPQRARPGAAGDAAGRRRTPGAAGAGGRTRRRRERQTGRALPAARPADHDTRAAPQPAAAADTGTAAAARLAATRPERPTRSRAARQRCSRCARSPDACCS